MSAYNHVGAATHPDRILSPKICRSHPKSSKINRIRRTPRHACLLTANPPFALSGWHYHWRLDFLAANVRTRSTTKVSRTSLEIPMMVVSPMTDSMQVSTRFPFPSSAESHRQGDTIPLLTHASRAWASRKFQIFNIRHGIFMLSLAEAAQTGNVSVTWGWEASDRCHQ